MKKTASILRELCRNYRKIFAKISEKCRNFENILDNLLNNFDEILEEIYNNLMKFWRKFVKIE